jgi:hypothetical protein
VLKQNPYGGEYLDIALKYITSTVFPIPQDELWLIVAGAVKTMDISTIEGLLGRFNPILASYPPFFGRKNRFLYRLSILVQRIPGGELIAARLRGPNVEQAGIDAKYHYLRSIISHDEASPDDDVLPLLLHWELPRIGPQMDMLARSAYVCTRHPGMKLLDYIYPFGTSYHDLAADIFHGTNSPCTETVIRFRMQHRLSLVYNEGELIKKFFTSRDWSVALLRLLLQALGPSSGKYTFIQYAIPVTREQHILRALSYNSELLFEFNRLDMLQHFMTAAMVRCILGADHVIEKKEHIPTYLALPEVRRLLTPVQRDACEKYHIREHLNLGWELASGVVYGCILPADIMSVIIERYLGGVKKEPLQPGSLLNPLTCHYYNLFKKLMLSKVDSRIQPPKYYQVPARVPRKRTSMKRRREEEN